MKKILYLWLLCAAFFTACNDDDKDVITPDNIKMLVVNQGLDGFGDLSAIYKDGTLEINAYEAANEIALKGTPHAINHINDKYFLTVSNPAKIEILNPKTLESLGAITYDRVGKPRDILPISSSEAIVSDSLNQLVKINTVTNSVMAYFTLPEEWRMEEITIADNKLFGTHLDAPGIAVFDLNSMSNTPQRVIPVSINKNIKTCKIHTDKNNKVWIFSTGTKADKRSYAFWIKIDPATYKIDSVEIPFLKRGEEDLEIGSPVGATYNQSYLSSDGGTIYFTLQACARLSSGQGRLAVFALNVDNNSYKLYRNTPGVEKRLNGMGISPEGEVYLCDENGTLAGFLRHFPSDESISAVQVGVKPRMIWFPQTNK